MDCKKIIAGISLAIFVSASAFALAAYAAGYTAHNWNCKKCGTVVKSDRKPASQGCPKATFHEWHDLGEIGNDTYQCTNCGITVQSYKQPSSLGCPNASFHKWNKLTR